MKIAFVINSLQHRRGAEVLLSNLIEEITKQKTNDCIVICLYDGIDESFENLFIEKNVPYYFCHKKSKFDFKSFIRFREIIKNFGPDIINTHLSILISYFFAFGFKKRKWHIVHTIHSVPNKESDSFTNMLRKIYIKKSMISFVGISDNITYEFKKIFKNSNITTINNGIKLLGNTIDCHKKYEFICVASFTTVKNHLGLIDFFMNVRKFDKNVKMLLVGEGPLKNYIIEKIKFNRLDNFISVLNPTCDIKQYLSISKYFILMSHYEGNPMSVLEAMSCGLPIIAPKVGGIPNIVFEQKNGVLFKVDDIDDAVKKYKWISFADYFELSYNSINLVNKFSIQHCANYYLDFFDKIISKN